MVPVILLLLWLLPVSVHAATYYVATTGNNANDGSETTPWLTVKKAVDTMVAGDTTYVRGGTYTETAEVRFTRSGTAGAPITLRNYPGEVPVIRYADRTLGTSRISIWNSGGYSVATGWIVIEGLNLTNMGVGIRMYSAHDIIIRGNTIYDNHYHGILGSGVRVLIDRNVIGHNGEFADCASGVVTCNKDHGIYLSGNNATITNNLIYDNLAYGIQLNGNATHDPSQHASTDYSNSFNWRIANNTLAYNKYRSGIVIWGGKATNARIENNIFYENSVSSSSPNGVDFSSCCPTGVQIRNNHFYASGSGGTAQLSTGLPGDLVNTGNVVNVSPPAFVNAASSSTPPVSPDFRLTALSPVNIALATEIPTNGVVGAFQPPATPIATISTNKILVTFPMFTAVPIQNLSTTGVSISCTANVCPGSPVVSSVSRVAGTDNIPEVTLSGITSDACLSHADAVTITYNSSTGSWTGNDNIGVYPGLNQKILSFTSLSVTNQCTGSGPPSGSSSHVNYPMENGSGATVSDTSGNGLHGTTSGTWVSGHTGYGINVATGTTQQITVPYGSGINPTTQSMTWVVPVYIPTGQTGTTRYLFGPELGSSQRGYIGAHSGTWRMGRQSTSISSAGASNLPVTEGWNYLCARWDSGTDTVTLYKGDVAGTGGATGSYTSFLFATNFEFPMIGTSLHATVPEATFDDVQVFTSLQDCAALYAAWNAPPPPAAGMLKQAAIRFNGVVLDESRNPIPLGSLVHSIAVPKRGGGVVLFEVKCNAGTDCAQTAFKLVYAKNGSTTWQHVPNTETADGVWMWGQSTEAHLNNGLRATSLTGSCTMQTGTTLMTADQVPSLALAQNTCTVLAYVVHVDGVAGVDYFDFKLRTEANIDLPGGYDEIARIKVVNPMGGGVGY